MSLKGKEIKTGACSAMEWGSANLSPEHEYKHPKVELAGIYIR